MLCTEIGFKSVDGAALNPGDGGKAGDVDLQEQADLYTAMFSVMAQEADPSWLLGMFLYHCVVAMSPSSTYYTSEASWGWKRDYSVEGKPAADVIRPAFNETVPVGGFTSPPVATGTELR